MSRLRIAYEMNFDGLVGPTHHYGGLSYGNIASLDHEKITSHPKDAARQGLLKMKNLLLLGLKQGLFPPQERPYLPLLRRLGYSGKEAEMLQQAYRDNPQIVMASNSAASMWIANAATVCPSVDAKDGKLHFTPANLISKIHRSFEAPTTSLFLNKIFKNPAYFAHHSPLPYHADFADEGAANHIRFSQQYGDPGFHVFVFGRYAYAQSLLHPVKFPARQTFEASQAVMRLNQIDPNRVLFVQQNPEAIDAGVFHNDVISVGNQNVFFCHEKAFLDGYDAIDKIQARAQQSCQIPLRLIIVKENQVPLREAIQTYLFNSQLITLPDKSMALLAPVECRHASHIRIYLNALLEDLEQPIRQVFYQDVSESMQNGGGPACLRLRVVLTHEEYTHLHQGVILTESLYNQLIDWVNKHYREELKPSDLIDPQLLVESHEALDALSRILGLGSIYSFQQ